MAESPPILRPVPLRPFGMNLREPTPPEDDQLPYTPGIDEPTLNLDQINFKLLDPRNSRYSNDVSTTVSRAQSVMNLTSSTLMGIYSPTVSGKDRFYGAGDELRTPWGTGAETPARGLSMDEPNYDIQMHRAQRAQPTRRRSSAQSAVVKSPPLSTSASLLYQGGRAVLLAGLGMLYGIMVATVHGHSRSSSSSLRVEHMIQASNYGWGYMAFWGASGLVLGSLLPWFDGIWESTFDQDSEEDMATSSVQVAEDDAVKGVRPNIDWTLAVRGIGMFIGIAFAIRKLPWDSTLQVSLTLALVNPLLWFLIDRSTPGFVASSLVGLAGSSVLGGLQSKMVPVPAMAFRGLIGANNASAVHAPSTNLLGSLANQEAVATGIWTINVLFCCCICFGNIGRWLALNRSTTINAR
ncbi:hypothetical protein F5Y16DRAFT_370596 [Xylariaceae sp. FL0255]|nr:hypothetical protein F5Y16DRAFT_370596 [Xylariaceae sp. FL0255]